MGGINSIRKEGKVISNRHKQGLGLSGAIFVLVYFLFLCMKLVISTTIKNHRRPIKIKQKRATKTTSLIVQLTL